MLAGREVLGLNLLLGPLDGLGHHPVLDRDTLLHAQALHQARNALGPEDAHQIVFEREVET
jgi:hypothetical protein